MKKIDWSKAPERATHYCVDSVDGTHWRDFSGETVKYWHDGEWVDHRLTPEYCLNSGVTYIARPAWNGEGPPPVGAKCEFRKLSRSKAWEWQAVFVNYMSEHTAVMEDVENPSGEHVHHPRTLEFRPIRTADQIEAEARKAAVDEMVLWASGGYGMSPREMAASLYDMGYRKQVAP